MTQVFGSDGHCGAPKCDAPNDCRYTEVAGGNILHLCDLHLKMVLYPEDSKNRKLRLALGLTADFIQGATQSDTTIPSRAVAKTGHRPIDDDRHADPGVNSSPTRKPAHRKAGAVPVPAATPVTPIFDPFE
jgi:hypothetical protein